jgi:5-methylcytosine-specific restriction endonuclease McrA
VKKVVISYVKAALRRTWGRSRQRQSALYNAKIAYGQYRCAKCGNIFRRKDIEVDHIDAVGKFKNFDTYIERLFCDSNKLAILCKDCHKKKTKLDRKK